MATAIPYAGFNLSDYIKNYANSSPGSVSGTPGHAGAGAYGTVPNVPDPVLTADQAIQGNIANLSGIYGLGGNLNAWNEEQLLNQYNTALPGYEGMVSKSSGNIAAKLAGQIPQDVLDRISQNAAERGIASGSPLDDNSNAAYLKAIGLTSLDLQNQGESELTNAIKRTPTAQLFNPSSFLISPEDEQGAQWAANQFAAAPDPTLAAQEAERKALAGIQAGKAAAGGGGTSILPSGGAGAVNPVTGTAFNPFSGGGGLSTSLGGGTSTGTTPTGSASNDLLDWWSNNFGDQSTGQDWSAGYGSEYLDPSTGNTITDQGTLPPYAGGYDPNLNQFNYDDNFLDQLGLGDENEYATDWDSLFGG